MITFRCRRELFERLEAFSAERGIDRTSVLKLALHYYLNSRDCRPNRRATPPCGRTGHR